MTVNPFDTPPMTDTDPLAAAQAKWAATRAAREAEAKKTAAEIRARYDELVARPVPVWLDGTTAPPAVVRAALNDLRDMRAGLAIPLTAWKASLEADNAGSSEKIIGLLTDAGFIAIDHDTAVVSSALPAESWNTLHPKPEPEPTQPDPEPASPPPTFTDEERGILVRAIRAPAGAAFAHSAKEEPLRRALVERGVLEKTAEPGKPPRWLYVHPSDATLSADDLKTVRSYSAAVIKKLTEDGRDSLAALDSKVGEELALIVKQRLDGVVIHHDDHGRWALIGGKPRLTRPEQRERAEQAAKPKPAPTPKPAPDTVTDHERTNAEIREAALLRTMREMDRKLDAIMVGTGTRVRVPSTDPRAHGVDDVLFRIAVLITAAGEPLARSAITPNLTRSQRELAGTAIAAGLLDGCLDSRDHLTVTGRRVPRLAVLKPPKGRTWDELHAAVDAMRAGIKARKVMAS